MVCAGAGAVARARAPFDILFGAASYRGGGGGGAAAAAHFILCLERPRQPAGPHLERAPVPFSVLFRFVACVLSDSVCLCVCVRVSVFLLPFHPVTASPAEICAAFIALERARAHSTPHVPRSALCSLVAPLFSLSLSVLFLSPRLFYYEQMAPRNIALPAPPQPPPLPRRARPALLPE